MTHPNATDAALYWGLIGVGVGLNPADRDATATGAREALRKAVAFAIADPGAALDRYRAHGETMPDFQALSVMVALDLLSRSKAASFTPHQAPKVDVMDLSAEYVQFVSPAVVLTDFAGASQTRRQFYDTPQMRAAFRHGWDAHAGDPAPEPAQIYCCSGCGWIALDPAADLVQLRSVEGIRSCCPERDMQPMDPREIMGKLMALRGLRREADAASVRLTTDALAASVPTPEEIEAALLRAQMAPRTCRVCGCTDSTACVDDRGPCWWVETDLCSHCRPSGGCGGTGQGERIPGSYGAGGPGGKPTADAILAVAEAAGQLEAKKLRQARDLVLMVLDWFDTKPPSEGMLDDAARIVQRRIQRLVK